MILAKLTLAPHPRGAWCVCVCVSVCVCCVCVSENPIGDTANVLDFSYVFYIAESFNSEIGNCESYKHRFPLPLHCFALLQLACAGRILGQYI